MPFERATHTKRAQVHFIAQAARKTRTKQRHTKQKTMMTQKSPQERTNPAATSTQTAGTESGNSEKWQAEAAYVSRNRNTAADCTNTLC
jgi:hypothetical protein